MPAVAFRAAALAAVPTAAAARAKASDTRNDAQGGACAWSPPV
jgi:hypothetical protein